MQKLQFNSIIENLPNIDEERNYWLVRSMGGDFYREFKAEGFIAIGYNRITDKDIRFANSFNDTASTKLKEIVNEKYSGKNTSYIAHQLLKFANEINFNDIIIVPGRRSSTVMIGCVGDEKLYVENEISHIDGACQFNKRRKITWLEEKSRWNLNPKMQLLFNSRHIISNINSYAPYIDATTNDFYLKGDKTHLVLSVKREGDIKIHDFLVINDLLELVEDISKELSLGIDTKEIEIKSNVQSPGDIILAAISPQGIALIGVLIIFLNGGGLKLEKLGFNLHTDGIIKSISNYLDRKRDREFKEMISKKIEHLDIQEPDDLVKILNEMNSPREKY